MDCILNRSNLHQTSKDPKKGHHSKELQESELCHIDFRKINV